MAWKAKDSPPSGGSISEKSYGQVNPSMHLQFRSSGLIRLFAILSGALLVSLGVQASIRFDLGWLPYVTASLALVVIAWAIGYQVWAYDGKLEVRSVFGVRTIPVAGAETIVWLRKAVPLGQSRVVAVFVSPEHPVQHYKNTMLTSVDFERLVAWTGLPVVRIDGRWTTATLKAVHPELLEARGKRSEPQLVWTSITLVISVFFVGVFYFFAQHWAS